MTNYRRGFFLAGIGNAVLLGLLIGTWWYMRGMHGTAQPAATGSSSNALPTQQSASGPAIPLSETPLVPVQLSAERLQSIGVKFGIVERKPIQEDRKSVV